MQDANSPEWIAWQSATELRHHLLSGGALPEIPAPPVNFGQGLRFHADLRLGYSRWYAAEVTYARSSALAFGSPGFVVSALAINAIGNSVRRSRALALAIPQWREHQMVPAILTSQCIVTFAASRWQFWYFNRIMTITPVFAEHSAIFTFDGNLEPLRLQGVAAAWLSAAAAYLVFGVDYLCANPNFSRMGPSYDKVRGATDQQERIRELP
ncbi:hypothetical protein AB0M44_36235 [Streptosporangium subroseum]|uniref:hypothetical protein n=1 Tax=Streptosporangium subroseum TaxID=106412 RepID=UPI003421CA67